MENFITIIENLSPIINIIISAIVSCVIATVKTRNELKKNILASIREDELLSRKSFSELTVAIEEYCNFNNGFNQSAVIKANSNFISIAPDSCLPILSELSVAISSYNIKSMRSLNQELTLAYLNHIQNSRDKTKQKQD